MRTPLPRQQRRYDASNVPANPSLFALSLKPLACRVVGSTVHPGCGTPQLHAAQRDRLKLGRSP